MVRNHHYGFKNSSTFLVECTSKDLLVKGRDENVEIYRQNITYIGVLMVTDPIHAGEISTI